MVNISDTTDNMAHDDSLSFYKSLRAGQKLLPLIKATHNHAALSTTDTLDTLIIKEGTADITLKNDSTIMVPSNTRADIFITSTANLPSLKVVLSLGEEAQANVFWQDQPLHGFIRLEATLARASHLNHFSFLEFKDATRFQQHVYLQGVGATANIFVGGKNNDNNNDEQHPAFADSTIRVVHEAKDSLSQIVVRGVVDNNDIMIGQVRTDIVVDATGADTSQDIKAIVLSPEAKFYGKPELNIKHDQVKAKHGLSIGAMDDEQIYYLRARGIDKATAQQLLMTSFFMNGLHIFSGGLAEQASAWLHPFVNQQKEK